MPLYPSSVIQSVSNPPLRTDAYVEITRMFPMFPRRVFVQWVLRNPVAGEAYQFTVERSGSAAGPWEMLTTNPTNEFYYADTNFPANPLEGEPDLMSISRVVYYRVTAIPHGSSDTLTLIKKVEPWLDRRREGIHRKLVRDAMISLQRVVGTEMAALKKKRWGHRCSLCLSKSGMSVDPYCPECYGTGITDGFWAPVYGWAQLFTAPISVQSALQGETEMRQTRVLMANVPQMNEEDFLVFLRSNRRFRVLEVTPTQIHNVDVHQELIVSELSPDSTEYNIGVDPWRESCWWV